MKDATLCDATTPELHGEPVARLLDAGRQNCTVLILNVHKSLERLRPGEILAVKAFDPSAQLDLRAWCRMTGHRYLAMESHGDYSIYYLRK